MTTTLEKNRSPLETYRRMQDAVLQGRSQHATLLPEHLLATNVVVETPFAPEGARRYDGREAWLSYYRSFGAGLLINFEAFTELATHVTQDPDVLVVEYELTGRVISTNVRSSVRCIAMLRVNNGLITHWREYQDIPAITRALA